MTVELELDSRREIYAAVRDDPGIHFRGLLARLDYAHGTLQYHLRWLVNERLVAREADGDYTRYYPVEGFDEADRATMNALRRKTGRRIVAHLATDGPLTTSDLSERLDRSASTVSWHLSKLTEAGLVAKERDGRSVYYSLSDPDRAKYLYTVYQGSFTDRLVDRLLGLWEGY